MRQKNISGEDNGDSFAAPIDLFVSNVNKDIETKTIVDHMKSVKKLEIIECTKISHEEARNASYRIKINAKDHDLAMSHR